MPQSSVDASQWPSLIPYLYRYITQLCKKQAEVVQNCGIPIVRAFNQEEAMHRDAQEA